MHTTREMYKLTEFPCIKASQNRIVEVNKRFLELTGYEETELINKDILEFFDLLCRKRINIDNFNNTQRIKLFTKTLKSVETSVASKFCKMKEEKIFEFTDIKENFFGCSCSLIEEMYEQDFLGVCVLDAKDFTILKVNKKYIEEMESSNLKEEQIIGNNILDYINSYYIRLFGVLCKKIFQTKKSVHLREQEYIRITGEKTYWNISVYPIFVDNEVKSLMITTIDVTQKVVYKYQKEELEKIIFKKNQWFSFISHEFKTPLTVISAAIQALQVVCKDELSNKAKEYIFKIRQNTLRQLRLVNNLLDVSKAESGHMKLNKVNMDIVTLTRNITESVKIFATQKGVELNFASNIVSKNIEIDEEKYERILLNLLSNAIKFTPSGKNIIVIIKDQKDMVELIVKDTGVGIEKEKQKMIFEPFKQVDESLIKRTEGSGIGLALVKMLVCGFGGEITVESEIGRGTAFKVVIPVQYTAENVESEEFTKITDSRLIEAVKIEFSDLYETNKIS